LNPESRCSGLSPGTGMPSGGIAPAPERGDLGPRRSMTPLHPAARHALGRRRPVERARETRPMFDRERTLYAFLLDYARKLADGIADAHLADQPAPGLNHPAWILGHLSIGTDIARQLLGKPTACPESWPELFGPGSTPRPDRSVYPSKEELLGALARGHEAVARASAEVSPESLAGRHTVDLAFLKESIPTVGDLLAHLMTTHEATHLGQLSAWRRMMGLPGVLQL